MNEKILLVEDEALIAMNEVQMLKKHGYEVVTAYKGEKAVEMVDSDPEISLILMDIDLGKGMDGTEAATEILGKMDIPIVFLSSHTEPEVVEKTEKITSYGYVVKNSGATVLDTSIKMAFKLFDAKMEHKQKEEDLRISEHKYRILFENMNVSFCLHEAIYDDNGKPVDYRYLDMNPMFLNNLGCTASAIRGHTAKELFPNTEQYWIDTFGKVAKTGESVAYQNYSRELNQWFNTFVFSPQKNQFATFFVDITARKKAEEALQEKNDLLERIFNSNFDLISLTDLEGNFTLVSKSHEILGYYNNHLLGKSVMAFVHPDDVDTVTSNFTEFLESGENKKVEYRYKRINGEYLWFETIGTILSDKKGNPEQILFNTRNITDHKQQEEILKKTKRLLSESQQIGKVGGWEFNIDTLEQNWTEETFRIHEVDLTYDNTVEKGIDFYTPDSKPIIENAVQRAIEFSEPYDLELKIITAKGNLRHVHTIGKIDVANRRLFGFFQDITERKRAEEALRESKKEISSIFRSAPVGIGLVIDRVLKTVNKRLCQITGYEEHELIGQSARILYLSDDDFEFVGRGKYAQIEDHGTGTVETRWQKKDGSVIYVLLSSTPVDLNNLSKGVTFTALDITDRKRMETAQIESEEKHRRLFETSIQGVVYQSADGTIISANPAAARILGMSHDQMIGKQVENPGWKMICEDGSTVPVTEHPVAVVLRTGQETGPVIRGLIHPEKENYIWLSITAIPQYRKGEATPFQVYSVFEDITERKHREEKLQIALEEKTFLMRELNHRVKNNLLMISSLISLKDFETEIDLSDLQHQIGAIGLIHEKLNQTENVTEISCGDYFDDLLNSIFSSFTTRQVKVNMNIDDEYVPTKTALTLGLIINEIATNAIKHGFSDKEEAVFTIEMNKDKENNQYELILSNTGNPFPEDINFESTDTLGLRLITTLVDQIDGTIELQNKPNSMITIRFPVGYE